MTRALLLLPPLVGGLLAFAGARTLRPAPPPDATAAPTPPVPTPAPAARPHPRTARVPCPPAPDVPATPDPLVPAGWDATADEQRLWTTDAAALEAAGGQLVTADCARYPCLAIVAFGPQPGAAEEGPLAAMRARWPEADVSSRTTLLGGQVVRWYAVVVDPPGSPDVEREVALRQLALAAEGNGPAVEWLETQVQAAPPSP